MVFHSLMMKKPEKQRIRSRNHLSAFTEEAEDDEERLLLLHRWENSDNPQQHSPPLPLSTPRSPNDIYIHRSSSYAITAAAHQLDAPYASRNCRMWCLVHRHHLSISTGGDRILRGGGVNKNGVAAIFVWGGKGPMVERIDWARGRMVVIGWFWIGGEGGMVLVLFCVLEFGCTCGFFVNSAEDSDGV